MEASGRGEAIPKGSVQRHTGTHSAMQGRSGCIWTRLDVTHLPNVNTLNEGQAQADSTPGPEKWQENGQIKQNGSHTRRTQASGQ